MDKAETVVPDLDAEYLRSLGKHNSANLIDESNKIYDAVQAERKLEGELKQLELNLQ